MSKVNNIYTCINVHRIKSVKIPIVLFTFHGFYHRVILYRGLTPCVVSQYLTVQCSAVKSWALTHALCLGCHDLYVLPWLQHYQWQLYKNISQCVRLAVNIYVIWYSTGKFHYIRDQFLGAKVWCVDWVLKTYFKKISGGVPSIFGEMCLKNAHVHAEVRLRKAKS